VFPVEIGKSGSSSRLRSDFSIAGNATADDDVDQWRAARSGPRRRVFPVEIGKSGSSSRLMNDFLIAGSATADDDVDQWACSAKWA